MKIILSRSHMYHVFLRGILAVLIGTSFCLIRLWLGHELTGLHGLFAGLLAYGLSMGLLPGSSVNIKTR